MGATQLLLVRHGESLGNAAASAAERDGTETIDIPMRDADVPLTETGVRQATAVGAWLRDLDPQARPTRAWTSPYVRAATTGEIAIGESGIGLQLRVDERLRDRELGITDLLTTRGFEARLPFEAQRRRWLGKFYYRPPGGESWADMVLRARSVLSDIDLVDDGEHVMVVCHDAMILILRYVCEGLSEAQLLEISQRSSVANASMTRLSRPSGSGLWTADSVNDVSHLSDEGAPVTTHSGGMDDRPTR
jgi:broad specificity phosphatase PhoE